MDNRLKVDDDMMWLHQMSVALFEPASVVKAHYDVYHEHLEHLDVAGRWSVNTHVREALGEQQNYLFNSVWLAAMSVPVGMFQPASDYPAYTASMFIWAYMTQILLVALVIAAVFFFSKDPRVVIAFAVAIAALATLDMLGDWLGRRYSYRLISPSILLDPDLLWRNIVNMFFDPTPQFTPYYPPPKNRAQFLLMAVVLFRWQGRLALSYLVLLVTALFHLEYAGLFALAFIAIDLVRQPALLRDPRIAAMAALPMLMFAYRSALFWSAWESLSTIHRIGAVLVAALLAGIAALLWSRLNGLRVRLMGEEPASTMPRRILQDLALLGLLWLSTMILLIPVSLTVSEADSDLLWGNVHGRLYGMFHPALVLGLSLLLVGYVMDRLGRNRTALMALAGCLAATMVLADKTFSEQAKPERIWKRIHNQASKWDTYERAPATDARRDLLNGEELFFYLSAKSLDLGKDYVTPVFIPPTEGRGTPPG